MNDTIKKKVEKRETKKNIWLNNKLNTEALFSNKDAKNSNKSTKKYLKDNVILSQNQFGFETGLSTENALNKILSYVYYTEAKINKISMLGLLDLSKAFC